MIYKERYIVYIHTMKMHLIHRRIQNHYHFRQFPLLAHTKPHLFLKWALFSVHHHHLWLVCYECYVSWYKIHENLPTSANNCDKQLLSMWFPPIERNRDWIDKIQYIIIYVRANSFTSMQALKCFWTIRAAFNSNASDPCKRKGSIAFSQHNIHFHIFCSYI